MLRQRVYTALFLLALVILSVFALPFFYFSLALTAVILMAVWEWSRLAGLDSRLLRGAYFALFFGLLIFSRKLPESVLGVVLTSSIVWWILASILILNYPRFTTLWGSPLFLAVAGVFVLLPGWAAFLYLREQDNFAQLILLLLATVAAADIGAYFAGRAFGKNQLAPQVSPNKTWEGFWGGVLACCVLVSCVALYYSIVREPLSTLTWLELLLAAVLLGTVSVIGDLLESMVKRFREVKDSGTILPGHGGILDRIDSISAAAPIYALLVMYAGNSLL